ncbi:TIGR02391 family protein [Trichlorobacter lovleyi]|uniref:TIGR02391 family protein n=1 Tax=Trichlorobacter lovleyi TaxID=313985 RepID=UPI0009FC6BC9
MKPECCAHKYTKKRLFLLLQFQQPVIRERTGLDKDGSELVTETFSLQRPILVVSTLDTESGRNDQKGFIQMLLGIYQGVRNPKAHTLNMNPSQNVAAQYLVFSSLLCRRVEESILL